MIIKNIFIVLFIIALIIVIIALSFICRLDFRIDGPGQYSNHECLSCTVLMELTDEELKYADPCRNCYINEKFEKWEEKQERKRKKYNRGK